jgi:hypothetical protein
MRTRFIACPACARHVRAGDSACPFCGTAVPSAQPLRTIRGRLSRAAMHAAGAAGAVVAIADCSSTGNTNTNVFYGAVCVGDACTIITDAEADAYDANTAVFYGAACPDGSCFPGPDAGGESEAAASPDAGGNGGDAGSTDAPADSNGGG